MYNLVTTKLQQALMGRAWKMLTILAKCDILKTWINLPPAALMCLQLCGFVAE
jgi:hypothetical protein